MEELKCQICGKPAIGTPEYWRCLASKYHYWRWRTNKLRAAKRQWEKSQSAYQRQVLDAFRSDTSRADFLTRHAPTYPAGA